MSESLSDQMRRAISECGMTRYELASRTGVDQAALSRFVAGTRGLSLKAIDSIGEVLGWTLKPGRKSSRKGA